MRPSLVLVFLAISPFVFAQESSLPAAKEAVTSETPSASPEIVLDRIEEIVAEGGTDLEFSADLAGTLGFTTGKQAWPYRQMVTREDQYDTSSPVHIFAVGRERHGDALIFVKRGGVSRLIRIDSGGKAARGISISQAEPVRLIPAEEAQAEANAEIAFWNDNAEKTMRWKDCTGELSGPHPASAEKKIAGCTWIIQLGKETPRGLANAYINRGMAYEHGHTQQELDDFNQAIKADPTNVRAWVQLCGVQNWITKEETLAIQSCSKAIELDPKSAEAWTYRGDIYLRGKEYERAIADYDHAIMLNASWMWPLDNRGEAYLRMNEIDRAIEDFNSVILVSPDYARGFLDRGRAEMRKDELDAALRDFQAGLTIDPKCVSCIFGQGLVKRAKGDLTGGDADIAKAKALIPTVGDEFVEAGIRVP